MQNEIDEQQKYKEIIEKANLDPNFNIIKFIGQGTYGQVFQAFDIQLQKTVAIKKVKLDFEESDEGIPATTLREISLLKKLKHNNIVNLLDISVNTISNIIFLVFDFYEQDLTHFIYGLPLGNGKKFLVIYQNLLKQILQGILFCHASGIFHRDLKPGNILLSSEGVVKIADFGMARPFNYPLIKRKYTSDIVTLWYRSPELLLGEQQYDTAVDIWSIGCIFGEMLRRKPFFKGDSQIDQLFKIFKFFGTPLEQTWPGISNQIRYQNIFPKFYPQPYEDYDGIQQYDAPEAFDLLFKMLAVNPANRINAVMALQHEFFKKNYSEFCQTKQV